METNTTVPKSYYLGHRENVRIFRPLSPQPAPRPHTKLKTTEFRRYPAYGCITSIYNKYTKQILIITKMANIQHNVISFQKQLGHKMKKGYLVAAID